MKLLFSLMLFSQLALGSESKWTLAAQLFAGIKNPASEKLQNTSPWKKHHQFLEKAWKQLESKQLSKVQTWSGGHLKAINESPRTIFYPFSGPDFVYAHNFFPSGKDYVLIGLEPVGEIADLNNLSDAEIDQKLQNIRNSLFAVLQFSFFRTNAMKEDMATQGVLPVLLVFLARTQHQIIEIQNVQLSPQGKIQRKTAQPEVKPSLADSDVTAVEGIKIVYQKIGSTITQNLFYFSSDISNQGIKKTPHLEKFIQYFYKPATYLKAASYLMHMTDFSKIRDLILQQSLYVLQDDSGIPYKFFDQKKWDTELFGHYNGPISLFKSRMQNDLAALYAQNPGIAALDFGIGYKYGLNESNLMLATRKNP